ncbi:MAG: DUF2798 domain-containing protein [archaeon]|nr:DUF2798 domain-containing protein [archaeon]
MDDPRLPRCPKEGIIFGTVVAAISCAIIGGINIYLAVGSSEFLRAFLTSYLIVFAFAFVLSNFIVEGIARRIVGRFYRPGDSVNSMICYNLIAFVLMMSASMSVLGPLAGQIADTVFGNGSIDLGRIVGNWINIWPRNFCIAFWVEMLIAQPIGRMVMVKMHTA